MPKRTPDAQSRPTLLIDEGAETLTITLPGQAARTISLWSSEAFGQLSRVWLKCSWHVKHSYSFTWLGRPVIQLPEDLVRVQEIVHRVRPQVIIETGVAHGGSLIFYASLLKLLGGGRVVGIDVDIRPHNRLAIETHELASLITLIEGSSTAQAVVEKVRQAVQAAERVLVILDSNHTRDHVLAELEAYAPLVSVGSYAIATDGFAEVLAGDGGRNSQWAWDNPKGAAAEFVARNADFVIEEPWICFNEGTEDHWVGYWSGGLVKRVR
jgi:cephalosporin hydroxylase